MKTKHLPAVLVGLFGLAAPWLGAQQMSPGFVAHEWGTFTSFQGGDGKLLPWKPLVTAELPKFVYDWQHPGMNRTSMSVLTSGGVGKGDLTSLQRMETPVIYLYADQEVTVDVTVKFPQGAVTEWYPQAAQIGPAQAQASSNDNYRAMADIPPAISPSVAESLIRWPTVMVMPSVESKPFPTLPTDDSGSHYFAARETDASRLVVGPVYSAAPVPLESEKFLFYRGVGNFTTPLRVVMKSDDGVDLANTGMEGMADLFVLDVQGKAGVNRYAHVKVLPAGGVKTVVMSAEPPLEAEQFKAKLSKELSAALVETGLYPREAAAMVNTWKDSWLTEPGVRVLYVLPRAWTDRTLPITMKPAPRELVRTMIGRAEVFPPGKEHELAVQVDKARKGDAAAPAAVRQMLKNFGRFAEPALNRVLAAANPSSQDREKLLALLQPERATK